MVYLTYEEYVKLGGKVEQSTFPILERKARHKVDYYTQDRIKKLIDIPECVKDCMAEFIDKMAENMDGEKVASFSNGSVSVSFAQSGETLDNTLYDIVIEYLPVELISAVIE